MNSEKNRERITFGRRGRQLGGTIRKRRVKENLHPLLDAERIRVTKERADVLYAFFPSVFKGKVHYPQGTKSPELENKDREQKEIPTI